MYFTPDLFGKMNPEELGKYIELLNGLYLRLTVDDVHEDHRRSPKVLSAKYLATTDVERTVESLNAYQALVSSSSDGESPPEAIVESGQ